MTRSSRFYEGFFETRATGYFAYHKAGRVSHSSILPNLHRHFRIGSRCCSPHSGIGFIPSIKSSSSTSFPVSKRHWAKVSSFGKGSPLCPYSIVSKVQGKWQFFAERITKKQTTLVTLKRGYKSLISPNDFIAEGLQRSHCLLSSSLATTLSSQSSGTHKTHSYI